MNPIKHVAIIMDGNGRWGIKNKGNRNLGHKAGLETIEIINEETIRQNIDQLTYIHFQLKIGKDPKKKFHFCSLY